MRLSRQVSRRNGEIIVGHDHCQGKRYRLTGQALPIDKANGTALAGGIDLLIGAMRRGAFQWCSHMRWNGNGPYTGMGVTAYIPIGPLGGFGALGALRAFRVSADSWWARMWGAMITCAVEWVTVGRMGEMWAAMLLLPIGPLDSVGV